LRIITALSLALFASIAIAGPTMADQTPTSNPPATTVMPWPGRVSNPASYWENYFGEGWDCTKVNQAGSFTTTVDHDAIVVKAGQYIFIWKPAPAGTYSTTSPAVSHWYYCDTEGPVEDRVIAPTGDIGGPCADPAYYGIFDNTQSTVPITFRFRWYTNSGLQTVVKTVPAGAIYRTWEHWVKSYTTIRVGYQDPDTGMWINLATLESVNGMYPVCVYKHGLEYPTS
jgi:hypothetical protein